MMTEADAVTCLTQSVAGRRPLDDRNRVDGNDGFTRRLAGDANAASVVNRGVADGDLDDGGGQVLLDSVLSNVRRAYCRQPTSATVIDDGSTSGTYSNSKHDDV